MKTYENQALLVAVSDFGGNLILSARGEVASEAVRQGDVYLGCLPNWNPDKFPDSDGLWVWEGTIDAAEDEEYEGYDISFWHGEFRPARVGDLERFGMRGLEEAPSPSPKRGTLSEAIEALRKAGGDGWDKIPDVEAYLGRDDDDEEVERLRARVGELARRELRQLLGDLSEDCYCAGWLIDWEYTMWAALIRWETAGQAKGRGRRRRPNADDFARMRRLATEAGGWCRWGADESVWFVPMDEWLRFYAEREARQEEGDRP